MAGRATHAVRILCDVPHKDRYPGVPDWGTEILISYKLNVGKAWSENRPKNQRRRTLGNRRYKFASQDMRPEYKSFNSYPTRVSRIEMSRGWIFTLPVKRQKACYKHRTTSLITEGQDSSFGIATGYGLDGPGIEARWRRDFPRPSRLALWPTQPPIQWITGLSRG